MAKKLKYPRKLRMTLEKVAENREQRTARETREEHMQSVLNTMYYSEFLRKSSVAVVHAKLNENAHRVEATYHLTAKPWHERVVDSPPWLAAEKAAP